MNKDGIDIFRPNIICNCVDSNNAGILQGRIYHIHSKVPFYYKDIGQMLVFMDNYFDCIKFPMASTQARSFAKTKGNEIRKDEIDDMQDPTITSHKGNIATFVVQVQYRQNSTWQGKVVWANQNKTLYFRSALELIRLMDGVIDAACGGIDENVSPNQNEQQIDIQDEKSIVW